MSGTGRTIAVGVDCATEEERIGLAYGLVRPDGVLELKRVTLGTAGESASATIAGWIEHADRYVVGFDAPLGWPTALGTALSQHRAGEPLAFEAERMFRRDTDRFVHAELGKLPPEVGADRIARTARAALLLLDELRRIARVPLPLGQKPGVESCVIEVFPAATLLSRGVSASGYKGASDASRAARAKILERLSDELHTTVSRELLIENSDLLDGALCALAAADYARGEALTPPDPELARKEGWIWFRGRGQRTLF